MPGLLDDPRRFSRVDRSDMLGSIYRLADPFLNPRQFSSKFTGRKRVAKELVFVGMGGSASAGDVLVDWLGSRFEFPVTVSRNPRLPRSVGRASLVVFLSYSGETWETLEALRGALRTGCSVMGVGSGGRLKEHIEAEGLPFFQVSPGLAPRAALGEMIVAGSMALQSLGVTGSQSGGLREAGEELVALREKLAPSVPVAKNRAKQLASTLLGRLPMVYAFASMGSVARRFKNQLAENAKVVAKYDLLPEACHNEIEAFGGGKDSVPVVVRDWEETLVESRVVSAFISTVKRATGSRLISVREKSRSKLGRLLAPILLLDYASAYLAVLRGIDPSPTTRIMEYKRRYAEG